MLRFEEFPGHVRLMVLAARTRLRENERAEIAALCASGLEWDRFLQVTAHHRLSSLVFETLEQVGPAGLPADIRHVLQARARANAFEALRAAAQVHILTAQLQRAGLAVSAMKGVALSQMLFGSPHARHVGDLDLLLDEPDVAQRLPQAIAALRELGYERINPISRLTRNRLASYVSFWKDLTFRNASTGFELDLHWRLFNNRFHAANRLLRGASFQTVQVFGVEMRVFSTQDQFLYIAAHGVLDAWTYLKSLADVAAFLRILSAPQLEGALERARQVGLLAQISSAIHIANDWMGAGISSTQLLPPQEATSAMVRARTTAMLLQQDFRPVRDYPSPAQWLRLEMVLVPGARSLLEIAQRFAWRPRVWASVDLPDGLFWMYPVLGLLIPPRTHTPGE